MPIVRAFAIPWLIACVAAPSVERVFFAWDQTGLGPEAVLTLDSVVRRWAEKPAILQLDGYSDRSGTPVANLRVTNRRLNLVRSELISRGVPANAIRSRSHHERVSLVETEDGVREIQNRRIELRIMPSP